MNVSEFQPSPAVDAKHTLPPTWLDTLVPQILARSGDRAITPTGFTRENYLDLVERFVRPMAAHQDATGALIDPVMSKEIGQTSPRFVASAAVLLRFGRAEDLREHVYRGMDWSCSRLAGGQAASPDFWLREIMTAWFAVAVDTPVERRARWEKDIRAIDPESVNREVSRDGSKLAELHNWAVYGAAGEAMRQVAGLSPPPERAGILWGDSFYDKYMPPQLHHFTNEGMYRDPGDPFTYDMTTRLQFATPLAYGYRSPLRSAVEELLRRGGLAQLLYVSPAGFAPFGGRSNQFHLQEAILSALGELEARRYRTSNPTLAGAFKRQARLSALSIDRWTQMQPYRNAKNGFPPEQMHAAEGYAGYSLYSLFAASCFALAALYADDSIAESPTPAEIGGYVAEFSPAFHKIFAVCAGTQIEIDTIGDPKYDATGLGRFNAPGAPVELGLFTPICATPNYRIADELKPDFSVAIAPAWQNEHGQWIHLAATHEGLTYELRIDRTDANVVRFRLTWTLAETKTVIEQQYELIADTLSLRTKITIDGRHPSVVRMIVPLLETDGQSISSIDVTASRATVAYLDHAFTVDFPPGSLTSSGRPVANRNGIYRPLAIDSSTGTLDLTLRLRRPVEWDSQLRSAPDSLTTMPAPLKL